MEELSRSSGMLWRLRNVFPPLSVGCIVFLHLFGQMHVPLSDYYPGAEVASVFKEDLEYIEAKRRKTSHGDTGVAAPSFRSTTAGNSSTGQLTTATTDQGQGGQRVSSLLEWKNDQQGVAPSSLVEKSGPETVPDLSLAQQRHPAIAEEVEPSSSIRKEQVQQVSSAPEPPPEEMALLSTPSAPSRISSTIQNAADDMKGEGGGTTIAFASDNANGSFEKRPSLTTTLPRSASAPNFPPRLASAPRRFVRLFVHRGYSWKYLPAIGTVREGVTFASRNQTTAGLQHNWVFELHETGGRGNSPARGRGRGNSAARSHTEAIKAVTWRPGDIFVHNGKPDKKEVPWQWLAEQGVYTIYFSSDPENNSCPVRAGSAHEIWDFAWSNLDVCKNATQNVILTNIGTSLDFKGKFTTNPNMGKTVTPNFKEAVIAEKDLPKTAKFLVPASAKKTPARAPMMSPDRLILRFIPPAYQPDFPLSGRNHFTRAHTVQKAMANLAKKDSLTEKQKTNAVAGLDIGPLYFFGAWKGATGLYKGARRADAAHYLGKAMERIKQQFTQVYKVRNMTTFSQFMESHAVTIDVGRSSLPQQIMGGWPLQQYRFAMQLSAGAITLSERHYPQDEKEYEGLIEFLESYEEFPDAYMRAKKKFVFGDSDTGDGNDLARLETGTPSESSSAGEQGFMEQIIRKRVEIYKERFSGEVLFERAGVYNLMRELEVAYR